MLNLPQVTLCCVDTRMPQMALDAMVNCMNQARFAGALLFTCKNHGLTPAPEGIRIIETDAIRSVEDYSRFLLKNLASHIQTSHMLIVQWDGYVTDASAWTDDFLAVDYIGAVWPQYGDAHRVGNGGFSLRSRKLLDALAHPDIAPHHPEDVCIARTCRPVLEQRWGIVFADEALANRFAVERQQTARPSFGFHGLANMALLLDEAELRRTMACAPTSVFASVEARGFVKNLLRRGMKDLAHEALMKRRQVHPLNWADLRLWIRWALKT